MDVTTRCLQAETAAMLQREVLILQKHAAMGHVPPNTPPLSRRRGATAVEHFLTSQFCQRQLASTDVLVEFILSGHMNQIPGHGNTRGCGAWRHLIQASAGDEGPAEAP